MSGLALRIGLLAFALLAAADAQAAGPWYVATNGADAGNDGLSWIQPFATVSNAIFQASASDTIWVSNGVYTLAATVDNSVKACKIRAASTNPADTVLLGPGSNATTYATGGFRGVSMSGAGSLLQGFTVTNFYYTNYYTGAGILCSAGLVSNCIIVGNIQGYPGAAGAGGGVYLKDNGMVENCEIVRNVVHPAADGSGGGVLIQAWSASDGGRIKNCRIVANRATKYGGGVCMGRDICIIQDSIIASNSASDSGGVFMHGGIVSNCQVFANTAGSIGGIVVQFDSTKFCSIMKCVISNNYGTISCGGLSIQASSSALISGCVIVSNRTTWATRGGLYVANGVLNVIIRNCLVANNLGESTRSDQYGGFGGAGMEIFATNTLIENCTITSNAITTTTAARNLGAGLYVTNGVRVVNSIIYHNRVAAGVSSNVYAASVDCTFSNCCTAPLSAVVGTANMDANPQFVSKDAGNYRLSTRSPCVNTGTNQGWMTDAVDIEGRKRLRYGTVDMGAYERIYDGSIYTVH